MKKTLIAGLLAILFTSCKKNNSMPLFEGLYIEVSPISGASHMNFINGSLVVFSVPGTSVADTFKYSFRSSKIFLTPNWISQNPPQEFELKVISESSFKIPNRHFSNPEASVDYMIFKK